MRNRRVLVAVMALSMAGRVWGQSACDLDSNGAVNSTDVSRAVNMTLGTVPCTANVEGPQTCSVVTVQRVINASLGQPCVTYNTTSRSVVLSWIPSVSVGLVGYNIYRRTSPTGTATKLNSSPVTGTTFTDAAPVPGQTYYYSATSTDGTNESAHSSQTTAVIPAS